MTNERRQCYRVNCDIPITITYNEQTYDCRIVNLSATGTCIECNGNLTIDDNSMLMVTIPTNKGNVDTILTILNSTSTTIGDAEVTRLNTTVGFCYERDNAIYRQFINYLQICASRVIKKH